MKKHWYDYLWILSLTYLMLGFFNILFAWLGLLCFFIPLIISLTTGSKGYCNRYCGRGQLLGLLGGRFGLSRKKEIPKWMKQSWFRYGFLVFFFIMFFQMLWNTYLVFSGAQDLKQAVTLLWTFKLPWRWAYHGTLFHPGVAQFAFGFYSVMLTSTILGLITMILYKPRSWFVPFFSGIFKNPELAEYIVHYQIYCGYNQFCHIVVPVHPSDHNNHHNPC